MEPWRKTWRDGFAPNLSTPALESLAVALRDDDPTLTQCQTTVPQPLSVNALLDCQGACAIGYCGWKGEGLETVGDVEEFFARACYECDQNLEEPAACRYLLNFWDEGPRQKVRAELLEEVERSIAQRVCESVCSQT